MDNKSIKGFSFKNKKISLVESSLPRQKSPLAKYRDCSPKKRGKLTMQQFSKDSGFTSFGTEESITLKENIDEAKNP